MELATKGASAKYLTGQGYRDSLDVAENRYIFALVQKLINLVGHELEVIKKRLQELERELSDITEQIKKLSNTLQSNELIVDKEEINNNIKYILNSHQKKSTEYEIIFLKFEKKIRDNLFEGKGKRNRDDEWFTKKGITFRFEFKGNSINKFLKEGCEYKVMAHYQKLERDRNTLGYSFKDISDMELLTDYTRPLNQNEKKEFQYKLEALKKKKISLSEQLKSTKEVYNLILTQLPQLKKIKLFFLKYKIKSRYHFTSSMTFIQNPNYQGSHKLYKQIINQSGMNDDLFDSLEEVDKIGILDIPILYERWCLLQIIKVLMDKFHFIPTDKNWKKILTEQISINNSKNITLNFKNSNIAREVRLTYEMVLENGRTPDFVLDIKGRKNRYYRFVMDAKFYENLDISKVIDKLYNDKDYAENSNNSVFILHPSKNQKSYYGEKEKFEWDNAFPNHRYGAVSLSPIQKTGNYLNDLQKLIGMFLQYGMEDNQNIRVNNKLDPMPKEKPFCMICGSSHQNIKQAKTRGGNYKYWVTCNDCSHMTIYNYCGKCKSRLIKNSSWTYPDLGQKHYNKSQ